MDVGLNLVEFAPGLLGRGSHGLAVDQERLKLAVESAVVQSFDNHRPLRSLLADNDEIVNPTERCLSQLDVSNPVKPPRCNSTGLRDFLPGSFGGRFRQLAKRVLFGTINL